MSIDQQIIINQGENECRNSISENPKNKITGNYWFSHPTDDQILDLVTEVTESKETKKEKELENGALIGRTRPTTEATLSILTMAELLAERRHRRNSNPVERLQARLKKQCLQRVRNDRRRSIEERRASAVFISPFDRKEYGDTPNPMYNPRDRHGSLAEI